MSKPERILVIRLGALGDLVLCFQSYHEIRAAHPNAEIALLTMPAFANFAIEMPWFDHVLTDERAPGWRLDKWFRLLLDVSEFDPTKVYDLQGKLRQNILYGLLGGPYGPEWSGSAPMCSHPRLWPPQPGMHFTDFVAAQLRKANVPPKPPLDPNIDLAWLDDSLANFDLPQRYVTLIPGCAKGREYKRWPPASYAALAKILEAKGIATVAVGGKDDAAAIAEIRAIAPQVITDLSGRTNLLQLAGVLRRGIAAVGNDTGPSHIAAAVGTPTLTLMWGKGNPEWSVPKGPRSSWLQGKPLESLDAGKVSLALDGMLDNKK